MLEALGVRRVFHKVRLKPGKPLWFGVGPPRADRPPALVFGLPGNPVSGLVGFLLFVKRPSRPSPASRNRGRLGPRTAREPIFPSRRPNDAVSRAGWSSMGADAAGLPSIDPSPGRVGRFAGTPRPTVLPSSPPATAITRPVKSSTSSLL